MNLKESIKKRLPQALLEEIFFWRSFDKNRLRKLKDIHTGQRAFVLGNGPSLNKCNLDKLKDVKRIFIHIESIKKDNFKIEEIISFSKKNNIELGLAISPKTNISDLFTYLTEIKNVMIMSVEPGKCGQKFIPKSIERIDVIKARFPDVKIQVDGGINSSNIKLLYNHNVDSIIIGSALKKESIEINKIINELFYSKMTSNVL